MSLAGSRLTRQSRAGDGDVVDECGSSPNVATTVVECHSFFWLDVTALNQMHSHVRVGFKRPLAKILPFIFTK
jgi:hypothetical protein